MRAMTYSPRFIKFFSDLMGSSEPSIRLCAIQLQASPKVTSQLSSLMGGTDAATSHHGHRYMYSSILRLANGAIPPRIRFQLTSLHTRSLHMKS